ncbi:MAG: ABC transporter permease subunit [Phycisphaerales bacterium]|nr:MAG: ABC transporter permease subunit [Phycisphaerales bacterium]
MIRLWCIQVLAIIRLEMKKTFLSRRGLWIYLLAFAPVLLFMGQSISTAHRRDELQRIASEHPISSEDLSTLRTGINRDEVTQKLGEPYYQWRGRHGQSEQAHCKYTDGTVDVYLFFRDGKLAGIDRREFDNLPLFSQIFAGVFQSYYLRLAVFFGCVGIFINLFRGEMLDKSLHFYLLTPVRREVLLAGKYAAGLLATIVIFTSSTALQWLALLWQFDDATVAAFLTTTGWSQFSSYLVVTALACVGYGSVFVAVGLLFRNPVVPTAVILLWEGVNPFLPAALKKVSMIYYLQSLCPLTAAPANDVPGFVHLLIAPVQPATRPMAVISIVLLTLVVLVVAARLSRRMEINYSTE